MARCIFCNKFSLLLNEKKICSSCFNTYSQKAIKVCEQEIDPLGAIIENEYNSLDVRKENLDKLKVVFEDFLRKPEGQIWVMYNRFSYEQMELNIKIAERELNNAIKKREIRKYSKIEGSPNDYIVFDLETTGFNAEDDAILEIGAIKYINSIETDRFHSYANPHRSIPKAASAVNHITQSKVKNAPDVRNVLIDFLNFIGDYTLISHNSDFDMSFIQIKCYDNLGKTVKNDVVDTLPLARKYLPQLPNKKLVTVKNHFNLDVGSHNAIDDCIVTNHLYQYCKQFEDLKYKYIIPFPYNPQELSDLEVEYINTAVEICEKNGISKKDLTLYKNSTLLSIIKNKYDTVVSFKLYGKLQYALLLVPFDKFENECQTEIKHTASTKSEGNYTRVFTENSQQLWEFQKYIK